MGFTFTKVPSVSIHDGIQRVRLIFPRFYVSEPLCKQFLNGIRNYRREWDEEFLKYRDTPVHDWTSHPVDNLLITSVQPVVSAFDSVDKKGKAGRGYDIQKVQGTPIRTRKSRRRGRFLKKVGTRLVHQLGAAT